MALETTEEMVSGRQEKPGFMGELKDFAASIPHKALFAVLLLAWFSLFHFLGNSNLGFGSATLTQLSRLKKYELEAPLSGLGHG